MIIFLIGSLDASLRLPLALKYAQEGHKVYILGSESNIETNSSNVKYIKYGFIHPARPALWFKSVVSVIGHCLRLKPSIIHIFDTIPGFIFPPLLGVFTPSPIIKTITGLGRILSHADQKRSDHKLRLLLFLFLHRLSAYYCTRVVFQNSDDQEFLETSEVVCSSKSRLIKGSGVDLDVFNSPSSMALQNNNSNVSDFNYVLSQKPDIRVVMVSRLLKLKGVIEYAEAAKIINSNPAYRNISFLLVGPLAPLDQESVDLVRLQNSLSSVHWLGFTESIRILISQCDIFVLPTKYREGVPRVLLEAGALGLPIVTSDAPGCRDVVEHMVTGMLVDPDSPLSIAEGIIKLIDNPSLRDKMSRKLRYKISSQYSLDIVSSQYLDVYDSVLL